ncbi:hypothetical protein Tco_1110273 [Tanacetum coccineum]|uniref:Uncharacterized protein n=1 Tax=Tanacetum coccineum TaxID=301880 RepID=A0ABQ5IJT6_9ASTR
MALKPSSLNAVTGTPWSLTQTGTVLTSSFNRRFRHLGNEPVSYHLLLTNPSAPPQVFEIGENYHGAPDTSYARHEEQIKTIMNHLDDLPLERI